MQKRVKVLKWQWWWWWVDMHRQNGVRRVWNETHESSSSISTSTNTMIPTLRMFCEANEPQKGKNKRNNKCLSEHNCTKCVWRVTFGGNRGIMQRNGCLVKLDLVLYMHLRRQIKTESGCWMRTWRMDVDKHGESEEDKWGAVSFCERWTDF